MIWDRDTANVIHHIRAGSHDSTGLSCLSWNHGSEEFVFATGSQDGTVKIWTDPGIDELPYQFNMQPSSVRSLVSPPRSPSDLGERLSTHLGSPDFDSPDTTTFPSHTRRYTDLTRRSPIDRSS